MTKSSNPESYRECFLGIDTSNYTTSLSVCDFTGKVLTNWKRMLPVKENERGLRQSDAVFHHVRNVPEMMPELNRFLDEEGYRPVAVGYSSTPRPNEDSYMPCFLVGKSVAVSIALALHIPSFDFSHH